MRAPTILDIVQAVTEVAPLHPELAVWWYERRSGGSGAPPVQVVVETRNGATADLASVGSELASRLGTAGVAVRVHRGPGETHALYRLVTAGDAPAPVARQRGW